MPAAAWVTLVIAALIIAVSRASACCGSSST